MYNTFFLKDGELERKQWNDFVLQNAPLGGAFLQSYNWGEFQKHNGNKIFRLVVSKDSKWQGVMFLVKLSLPFRNSVLYSPRGPIFHIDTVKNNRSDSFLKGLLDSFIKEVYKIAKKEKSVFLRIDPALPDSEELARLFCDIGFFKGRKEIQPRDTLIVDIQLDPDELLKRMKTKTRYNIRVAKRHNVKISFVDSFSENVFKDFFTLLEQTARRNNFFLHSKDYYKNMLSICTRDGFVKLFFAKRKEKVLAAALVSFFNDTATYLHGASSYEDRKYMAPYMLHWEIMQEARRLGYRYYDFNGVAPSDNARHPWQGITRFKRGFAPEVSLTHYIGSWEFAFKSILYKMYHFRQVIKS